MENNFFQAQFSFIKRLFTPSNIKFVQKKSILFEQYSKEIEAKSNQLSDLSDDEFQQKIYDFIQNFTSNDNIKETIELFALIREAASRSLGLRPYLTQIKGGLALKENMIAEMQTGEGKTLTAAFACIYYALKYKKPVHIVTANEYLAIRDAETMGKLYSMFGLSTNANFSPVKEEDFDRKQSVYQANIIYSSAHELILDYLRSTLATEDEYIFIKHEDMNFILIDEVDFILLDMARHPVLLSQEVPFDKQFLSLSREIALQLKRSEYEQEMISDADLYDKLNNASQEDIERMKNEKDDGDFYINDLAQSTILFESAYDFIDNYLKKRNIKPELFNQYYHHIQQALVAEYCLEKDKQYIMYENKVIMLNESTGRPMFFSRWQNGLHQAVEFKENAVIQNDNRITAEITYRSFFNLYQYKAGMTGTAKTEEDELLANYQLMVMPIEPNKPSQRVDHAAILFMDDEYMINYTIHVIKEANKKGQPVLIGTPNGAFSMKLSQLLDKEKLTHSVLNAQNIAAEAKIIAQAGELGKITISTNMAGRGTDIILGGNIFDEINHLDELKIKGKLTDTQYQKNISKKQQIWHNNHEKVIQSGGLLVICLGLNESRRITNQLKGRAGRQGDIGETYHFYSLDDELFQDRSFKNKMKYIRGTFTQMGITNTNELPPQYHKIFSWHRNVDRSQRLYESFFESQRKWTYKYEQIKEKQRKTVHTLLTELLSCDNYDEEFKQLVYKDINYQMTSVLLSTDLEMQDIAFKNYYNQLTNETINIENISIEQLADALLNYQKREWKDEIVRLDTMKQIMVNELKESWFDYLNDVDLMKKASNFAVYANKNPIQEFMKNSHNIFMHLLNQLPNRTIKAILNTKQEFN